MGLKGERVTVFVMGIPKQEEVKWKESAPKMAECISPEAAVIVIITG